MKSKRYPPVLPCALLLPVNPCLYAQITSRTKEEEKTLSGHKKKEKIKGLAILVA
jgi:hypothetical protein